MITDADGAEVDEVGAAAMAAPLDMVHLAPVERHLAVAHHARRVERPQHPPLITAGQRCRVTEAHLAGRRGHPAPMQHDGPHLRPGGEQIGESHPSPSRRPPWKVMKAPSQAMRNWPITLTIGMAQLPATTEAEASSAVQALTAAGRRHPDDRGGD